MRKKCVACSSICFMSDEFCKRCGSTQLETIPFPVSDEATGKDFYSSSKPNKSKFVKYFIFMIFAQFAILWISALLKMPIIFQLFYEPVLTVALKFMKMGHADVIMPLLLIAIPFFAYAFLWSYLLLYTRFRKLVFMPIRKGAYDSFKDLRTKLNRK
jgi:hypothetical protein